MATLRALRLLLLAAVALSTVACDQATKHIARTCLTSGARHELLDGVVQFALTENSGGFLSLGHGLTPPTSLLIFTVATSVLIVAVLVVLVRSRLALHSRAGFGLALLAAGGLGNLIDRLFRHGLVTDFCVLRLGPLHTGIFNIADVAILLGVVVILAAHADHNRASA